MKRKTVNIALFFIRISLMIFWLYVALDKLWDVAAFHDALLRQPFPNWWADVLYIALPFGELGLALLFIFSKRKLPSLLSVLLMLAFSLYIAFGVAGLYAERPCGCASIFQNLSWERHLIVNIGLLLLSLLGYWLNGASQKPLTPHDDFKVDRKSNSKHLSLGQKGLKRFFVFHQAINFKIWFSQRFAPFPGRPVQL